METLKIQRPKSIWAISCWYALSAIWGLFSLALFYAGALPLDAAQQAYFTKLGPFTYLSTVGGSLVAAVAAVQLFRLHKSAVVTLGAGVVISAVLSLIQILRGGYVGDFNVSEMIGGCLGFALQLWVFLRVRKMRDRGVLD